MNAFIFENQKLQKSLESMTLSRRCDSSVDIKQSMAMLNVNESGLHIIHTNVH